MRAAGVVDQRVDAAERLRGARDEVAHLRRIGHVGALRVDVPSQLRACRDDLLLVARADRDARALPHELLRDRKAEALRAAGDDRPPAFQAEVQRPIASRMPRRGGWKTSTWRQPSSCVRASCGTFGGMIDRVAAAQGARLARDRELELALENERDLLLVVPVERRLGVRREPHEVDHQLVSDDGLELQAQHRERLELAPRHPGSLRARL